MPKAQRDYDEQERPDEPEQEQENGGSPFDEEVERLRYEQGKNDEEIRQIRESLTDLHTELEQRERLARVYAAALAASEPGDG